MGDEMGEGGERGLDWVKKGVGFVRRGGLVGVDEGVDEGAEERGGEVGGVSWGKMRVKDGRKEGMGEWCWEGGDS